MFGLSVNSVCGQSKLSSVRVICDSIELSICSDTTQIQLHIEQKKVIVANCDLPKFSFSFYVFSENADSIKLTVYSQKQKRQYFEQDFVRLDKSRYQIFWSVASWKK